MKLTNRQVADMSAAIRQLDGYTIVENGAQIHRTYKIAGHARFALALLQAQCTMAITAFNDARDKLLMQYSNGTGNINVGDPGYGPFNVEMNQLVNTVVEISSPTVFEFSFLSPKVNEEAGMEIPISVFTALLPAFTSTNLS